MSTVFKIETVNSGDIEFQEDELIQLDVNHVQKVDMWFNLEGFAYLYKTGYPYKILTLTINPIRNALERMEAIRDECDSYGQASILRCFYMLNIDSTESMYVQMDRSVWEWKYFEDQQDLENYTLVFYESRLTEISVYFPDYDVISV